METMTRNEALKQLKLELSRWESDCKSYHKTKDALKYAIKELEQETTSRESYESEYLARKQAELELWKIQQNTSKDCISRQAVLDLSEFIGDMPTIDDYGDKLEEVVSVENIKSLPPVTPTTCIAKVTFSKDDLQELVDEKVKELAQRMESRWIPVSERLPEENGGYLVTVNQRYITTALWWGIPKYWDNVIAWMPLPKPYKAEMESEE